MTQKLRLYGAALLAVKTHFDNNEAFSAYDITTYIRDKVDAAEWELWNGGDAGSVKHPTIRGYIDEMIDNGLFYGGYDVTTEVNHNTGLRYKLFTPVGIDDIQDSLDAIEAKMNAAYDEAEEASNCDRKTADSSNTFIPSISVNDVRVEKLPDGLVAVHAPNGDQMVF